MLPKSLFAKDTNERLSWREHGYSAEKPDQLDDKQTQGNGEADGQSERTKKESEQQCERKGLEIITHR